MRIKGNKLTSNSVPSAEWLESKLDSIADITTKKIFGRYDIFHEGKMLVPFDSKGAIKHIKVQYYNI